MMDETVLENSACWSGDGEGKECAGSLLVKSTDMDPDNPCNYLLMPFSRVDNIYVTSHCCLCISSFVEEIGWSSSV